MNRTPFSPDWWLFFTKFVRHGTAIAALAPSSRWLARAIVRDIDFSNARCLVELGAGTGPVTSELLDRAPRQCRVLVLERDPDFCHRLEQRFPRAEVLQADALQLDRVLGERGISRIDHVLSGLPLPSFPQNDRDTLLRTIAARLTKRGTLRQLTHMPWVYQKLYQRYYDEVLFRLVPLNFPPGGVYICRGWKRGT